MYLWNQGFKFGSQPFSRVTPALLSFLTLSMAPYLKKPVCQTNLEDEVQPKGRGLFIGIVEQQLPTAIKRRVRAFISSTSSLHLYFFLCFSPLFPNHTGKHAKYNRALQAEVLHKKQQHIRQVWEMRPIGPTEVDGETDVDWWFFNEGGYSRCAKRGMADAKCDR